MPTTTAVVEDVSSRQTSGGTWYSVEAGGRKYDTKKRELATAAHGLKGQPASIDFTQSQNGQYTNYRLEGITGHAGPVADESKDATINRAVALKCAVVTLGYLEPPERSPEAAIQIANFYVGYLRSGEQQQDEQIPFGDDSLPF